MLPSTTDVKQEQLLDEVVKCMDSEGMTLFVEFCIGEVLEQTVESNVTLLANREVFSLEDIDFMKKCKLGEMKYEYRVPSESNFKIEMDDTGEGILFSDRLSLKNELKGQVLRVALDKLREENPEKLFMMH